MLFHPARFCLSYLGVSALLLLFSLVVVVLFDLDAPGGAAAVVPLAAAMTEGQRYGIKSQARPASADMWHAAVKMTGLALVISLTYGVLLLTLFPAELQPVMRLPATVWLGFAAFLVVFHLIALRLGYSLGIRAALRSIGSSP